MQLLTRLKPLLSKSLRAALINDKRKRKIFINTTLMAWYWILKYSQT